MQVLHCLLIGVGSVVCTDLRFAHYLTSKSFSVQRRPMNQSHQIVIKSPSQTAWPNRLAKFRCLACKHHPFPASHIRRALSMDASGLLLPAQSRLQNNLASGIRWPSRILVDSEWNLMGIWARNFSRLSLHPANCLHLWPIASPQPSDQGWRPGAARMAPSGSAESPTPTQLTQIVISTVNCLWIFRREDGECDTL